MAIGILKERGRAITIKDEGVTLTTHVASIDFAGAGVVGTSMGSHVTQTINDTLGVWGSITGTLSGQTDLQNALDLKVAGPSTSTKNGIVKYSDTGGVIVKDSKVIINDTDGVFFPSFVNVGGDTFLTNIDVSGGFSPNLVTKTASYLATFEDHVILCDATSSAITITLPVASTVEGLILHIKKTDNSVNAITVDGDGSETIDGGTTAVIDTQYESITIISDNSNWFIL